jgi:hypothetical protein
MWLLSNIGLKTLDLQRSTFLPDKGWSILRDEGKTATNLHPHYVQGNQFDQIPLQSSLP